MSTGKFFAFIFSLIFLLMGAGLFIGGVSVIAVNQAFKDDQGYISTSTYPMSVPNKAVAVIFTNINIDTAKFDPNFGFKNYGDLITMKVTLESKDDLFIGIADASDVHTYLENVSYAEITGIDYNSGIHLSQILKNSDKVSDLSASPIANQTYIKWIAEGDNKKPLIWEPIPGTWTLVIMKKDGTADLDFAMSAGANIPLLNVIGIFMIAFGTVFLLIGLILFFISLRNSRQKIVKMSYSGYSPSQNRITETLQPTDEQLYGTPAPKITQPSSTMYNYPESTKDEAVFVVADYGPRIVAFIIDALVVNFLVGFIRWPILFSNPENSFFLFPMTFSLNGIGIFIYFVFLEGKYGTTLGKEIMKLQVISETGEQPDIINVAKSALGKSFFLPIDFIVGLFMADDKYGQVKLNQRLMQKLSKSLVIVKPPEDMKNRPQFIKK